MANMAAEVLRVSRPVKTAFDAVQVNMTAVKGRQVTQSEVLEELLKCWEQTGALVRDIRTTP
jgi:hypothetical protein